MAKKPLSRVEKVLTRNDLNRLWTQIGDTRWLETLQKHKASHGFVHVGGGTLKGLCLNPEHADTSPSFFININRGYAHCFGCQWHTHNPIEILGHVLECSSSEVFNYLREQFSIQSISKKAQVEFDRQRDNLATKDAIMSAANSIMCEALTQPDNNDYAFARRGLNWLLQERAIPEEVLHCLPIGIMPPLGLLADKITDQYTQKYRAFRGDPSSYAEPHNYSISATEYLSDYSQLPFFPGCIVFPLHVTPTEIGRLKLREPSNQKEYRIPDDPYEDMLGIFGLGWEQFKGFTSDPNTGVDFAYLTEGEMDVLSVMARFAQEGHVDYPLFSVGGTGTAADIDNILKMSGFTKAFLVGDAPFGKGDTVVKQWLDRIIETDTKVFSGWDKLPNCKDLDEAVVKNGLAVVEDVLYLKQADNFSQAWQWAYDQAAAEIANLRPNDTKGIVLSASANGRYLRNRLECDLYVEAIANAYSLNAEILKREIATREDTESGFILRIKDALEDLFYLVGTDTTAANGKQLVLFNKKKRKYHRVKVDAQQATFQELAPVVGPPCDFIRDYVGYPGFMPDPALNVNSQSHIYVDKNIRGYVNMALMKWSKGAMDYAQANILNQGYHRVVEEGKVFEYIVCGSDTIKILRDSETGSTSYKLLDGPSDERAIFNASRQGKSPDAWYPGGLTVKQLEEAKNINIKELYDDIVTFFDSGFKFKNQKVVPPLLAAYMLLFPVMDAFERPPMLFITGDTNSGKSTLMSAFGNVGTMNTTGLRLLYSSVKYDNYTAAGVCREAANATLLRILDEFELNHQNKHHAEQVRALYETYRSMVNGLSNRIRTDLETGGVTQMILRHPIIFGAITGSDVPQDFNRLTHIEMIPQKGTFSPLQRIKARLSDQQLYDMSHNVNLALYNIVPALTELYPKIVEEYTKFSSSLSLDPDMRYTSAFFSAFTLMEYLGIDWKEFYRNWITANEDSIIRSATVRESDSVLKDMLFANVVRDQDNENPISLSLMLANSSKHEDINKSSTGVYFDRQNKLLVVVVSQAVTRLVNRPGNGSGQINPTRLKDILNRHAASLTSREVLDSGVLNKLMSYIGVGVQPQDVVVLHADAWVSKPQANPLKAVSEAETPSSEVDNGASENPNSYEFVIKD